jgi:tetratricopeptide (TPR) repeat protein
MIRRQRRCLPRSTGATTTTARLTLLTFLATLLVAAPATASWRAAADSLFAEADSRFESGDYEEAAELFARTIDTVETNGVGSPAPYFTDLSARARFLMARSHEHLEEWQEALRAYAMCLDGLSGVEDLVRFRMAVCHAGADDDALAMAELRVIIDDGVDTTYDPPAMLELARLYEDADDYDMALQWYRLFLTEAESYDERALAHYRMGRAFENRGDKNAAKRSYATAVNDFPRSRHAHDALKQGRGISRAFTDRYHQGLVLYNRKLYMDAAEFFTYYLRYDDEGEFDHEASYFLGRSHQRLGNYIAAAADFEKATEYGPDGEYYDLAWSKLAYCRRASGRLEESLATYERFAVEHPEREAAPELLWEKARLLEEKGRWEEAGAEFRRIVGAYPESERAGDALFRAGLCLFKLEDHPGALAVFEGILVDASEEDAARAHFWAAKCFEELEDPSEAAGAYARAVESARSSYYGARARIRLRELGHAEEPAGGPSARPARAGTFVRPAMWGGEALEFAAWLAEWYDHVYFQAERVELRQHIYSETAFKRADVFLALHLRSAALSELSTLAGSVGRDPRALDRRPRPARPGHPGGVLRARRASQARDHPGRENTGPVARGRSERGARISTETYLPHALQRDRREGVRGEIDRPQHRVLPDQTREPVRAGCRIVGRGQGPVADHAVYGKMGGSQTGAPRLQKRAPVRSGDQRPLRDGVPVGADRRV